MMGRWNSVGATSPLWGTGVILMLLGAGLVFAARRQVARG